MVVVMGLVLVMAVDRHRDKVSTGRAFYSLPLIGNAGDTQGVQGRQGRLLILQKVQQRSQQHVAGDAHGAGKIECSHGFSPIWLMRLA